MGVVDYGLMKIETYSGIVVFYPRYDRVNIIKEPKFFILLSSRYEAFSKKL